MSKAQRTLVSAGASKDPAAHVEMTSKHPQAAPPVLPAQDPEVDLSDDEQERFMTAMGRKNFAKLAQSAPACGSADQSSPPSCCIRRTSGGLLVSGILRPMLRGYYIPPLYASQQGLCSS